MDKKEKRQPISLRFKINKLLKDTQKKYTMQEIYTEFPDIAKTTIRGRVYDNLGKGITRLDKNLYISSEAIVQLGNSLEIIDNMIKQGDKFDYIFLDIPYDAPGQKGGNRDLFACDTITPEQFAVFARKLEKLLLNKNSIISFMFTSGKTSKRQHDKYLAGFKNTSLVLCRTMGTYTKFWKTGNRMNMGIYPMPEENIYLFNGTGIIEDEEALRLHFEGIPSKEYPTAKPLHIISSMVRQLSPEGGWVFDPFGGSGKTLEACLEYGRHCHIIDSSETSFNEHLLPILEKE